jgi:class 3 adenylate cyclase
MKKILTLILLFVANSLLSSEPLLLTKETKEMPLGLYLEILEDKEGTLTIDDIQKPEMESRWEKSKVEVPNFGFSNSTYWLRVELKNSSADLKSWFIEIAFPPIDYIDFYLMEENDKYSLTQTGDRRPFSTRQYDNKNYLFDVPIEAGKSKFVYLKTWSYDGLHESIPLVLFDKESYIKKSSIADTFTGVFIGIIGVMLFYNLFVYLSVKDISYLFYILYLLGFLSWFLIFTGYSFQLLIPDSPFWVNQCITLSTLFYYAMIIQFSRTYLSTKEFSPKSDWILKCYLGINYFYIPLSFIVKYSAMWKLIIISFLPGMFIFPISAILVISKYRPAHYYLIAWSMLFMGGTFVLLKISNILPSNFFTENFLIIGTALQTVLLSLGLADRINELKRQNEIIQIKSKEELQKLNSELEQKVIERTSHLEQAKSKIETLNEISKTANANLDIEIIMDVLLNYLKDKYKINVCALYTINKEKRTVENYYLNIPNYIANSLKDIARQIQFPLDDPTHAHGYAYKTKTALYTKKLRSPENKNEEILINALKMKSSLIIPLLLQNEVIGFIDLTRTNEELTLLEEDIDSLVTLSNQITSAINNSKLMKEIILAKEQADIDRGIALVAQNEAEQERNKSDKLLLNILPEEVADELKEKGLVTPVLFESTTIMFTDFKGFTQIAEKMTPQELIKELDGCFTQFDKITEHYNLEKLKTIGDSYMCAGGIPKVTTTHAIDSCLAALEIQSFMNQMKEIKQMMNIPYWELRLGIHSGSVLAGVVGEKKFAYDIWGDTVNTASRMESSGTPGRINISYATYELVKDFFDCDYRGEVNAKNKGFVKMYYLNRIKPEFSKDTEGHVPNEKFWIAKNLNAKRN